MSQVYPVNEFMGNRALLDNDQYEAMYQRSIEDPESFWAEQAQQFLHWDEKWHTVCQANFEAGEFAWFEGGKLNVTVKRPSLPGTKLNELPVPSAMEVGTSVGSSSCCSTRHK